jgi:phosphoketolase
VCCVVGDGEAETGPLAASWHSNKFLDPARDGAILPILQLNGFKIANPTLLARIPQAELEKLFEGYGYRPITVAVADPDDHAAAHQAMAAALDDALSDITRIQATARAAAAAGELEATGRTWMGETDPDDDAALSPDGRVMEVLSEHMCQGWLEGYLLTGRHGIFSCYEAFIHHPDHREPTTIIPSYAGSTRAKWPATHSAAPMPEAELWGPADCAAQRAVPDEAGAH